MKTGITVFLSNLPYHATPNEVRAILAKYGPYTRMGMPMREGGANKGFAFIDFANRADGERLIRELHEATWMGRQLRVREAEPEPPRRYPARERVSA